MENNKKENRIYLISLIFLAIFAIGFVSTMGFLNYKTTAIELEKQVITRVGKDNVSVMETAISFGKSFDNYYGIEEIFESFSAQYPGPVPFVTDKEGNLLYTADSEKDAEKVADFIESKEFKRTIPKLYEKEGEAIEAGKLKAVFVNIHQDEEIIGYFGCLYQDSIFDKSFDKLRKESIPQAILIALIECGLTCAFVFTMGQEKRRSFEKTQLGKNIRKIMTVAILAAGIVAISALGIYSYQRDYKERIETSARVSLLNLQTQIKNVRDQGVDLRDVEGLQEYIAERISSLETLHAVRVSEQITEVTRTDEESNIITFVFDEAADGQGRMYLQAESSDEVVNREMRNIILVLLSTTIILLIFVFELNSLVDLSTAIASKRGAKDAFSEKQVSLALRFTGFLCSTAEYMCVPYAAMMIRAEGTALFGLTVGMTAALPLTVEGLTQMIGMLTLPKFVKKFSVKQILIVSSLVMIASNISAFMLGGALTIIICRAIAGFAYSGFKQVSNYLITRGYETEEGRSDNISQDNAGLLAGATCGAGLGAILSANAGYGITFLFSGILFFFYLIGTLALIPWKELSIHAKAAEEEKKVSLPGIVKMFTSGEMILFIILIAIPLNIGVMLCVTLIPAICQTNNISSVMLSYCYIANGLAGIYLGPALVSKAKAKFGLQPCIAFTFAITALSIFILHLPPVAVMIIITSMVLGFLDGFGTPMVTDRFMSLKIVENAVDESTALIFFVVLSYVLLTFAPMVAELLLLPGNGIVSPMMIGAIVYGVAAVLVMLIREKKK